MNNQKELNPMELLTIATNKKTFEIIKWFVVITVFSSIMGAVLPIFYLVVALNILYTIFRLIIHMIWFIKAKNKLIKRVFKGEV